MITEQFDFTNEPKLAVEGFQFLLGHNPVFANMLNYKVDALTKHIMRRNTVANLIGTKEDSIIRWDNYIRWVVRDLITTGGAILYFAQLGQDAVSIDRPIIMTQEDNIYGPVLLDPEHLRFKPFAGEYFYHDEPCNFDPTKGDFMYIMKYGDCTSLSGAIPRPKGLRVIRSLLMLDKIQQPQLEHQLDVATKEMRIQLLVDICLGFDINPVTYLKEQFDIDISRTTAMDNRYYETAIGVSDRYVVDQFEMFVTGINDFLEHRPYGSKKDGN